jgi:hypothetical protein
MKINTLVLSLLAAGLSIGISTGAHAADADRIKLLEDQLTALQKGINELKKDTPSKKDVTDLADQMTLQGKESVVGGDIPNSFRIPNSETSLRIYGYAEANLIKDMKSTAPGDLFTNLPEQPLKKDKPTDGKTVMTGQTSRLGFETSTPTALGPIHTQVEGDFYAYGSDNRNRFRLRHAYGEYAGWLIGQSWSTFMDLDNGPETADFNGPIGMPSSRPVQIRYTYNIPTGPTFKAAIENPSDGANSPNLVLAVSKSFDWGGMNARFVSHEQRSDKLNKRGRGFGLGGSYKLIGDMTLMGQFAEVDGDNDNALMYGANYPDKSTSSMLLDKSRGFVMGLTNVFSPQMRGTIAYGSVKSMASTAYIAAYGMDGNKRLSQWHVNLFYTAVKNVDLGAELIGGKRTTFGGDIGDLSRFNLLAKYSFN